jgi:tetratricopeptide (TPR) repeat protein
VQAVRERLGAWLLVALAAASLTGCVDLSARAPAVPPVASARDVTPDSTVAELADWCARTTAARDWDQALPACERVAVEAPSTPDLPDRLVRIYLAKGRAALSPGDVALALRWFSRAHDVRPDVTEVAGEYALALAYRAGEAALAAGDWDDALAKFQAVYDADPLYLAWLPERAPRRRLAEVHVTWGRAALDEHALDEAESHCARAVRLVVDLPDASDCLAAVAAARPPTPTSTPTPAPTRVVPIAPPRPAPPVVAPPRRAAPPVPVAPRVPAATPAPALPAPPAPNVPLFGAPG